MANIKHGYRYTKTYKSWDCMIQRCLNSNSPNYSNYGGRGITICKEWINDFRNFLQDMGERPENTSIDRIDVDGNYNHDNCRWATPQEQEENKR